MSTHTNMHHAKRAYANEYSDPIFSTVTVEDGKGSVFSLVLEAGKAQAVADAINAALGVEVPS
jgi:hypothetical protein